MRFHVKNEDGEMIVSSYAELRKLYARQFITDEDEIRREGSEHWVRAGSMPDLLSLRPKRWQGNEFLWIMVAILVGTGLIAAIVAVLR